MQLDSLLPKPRGQSKINTLKQRCAYCGKSDHGRDECWSLHGRPWDNPIYSDKMEQRYKATKSKQNKWATEKEYNLR